MKTTKLRESTPKHVWLNIHTGEFSNSWSANEPLNRTDENLLQAAADGWNLIEFKCLNDEFFQFTKHMKLK